MSSHLPTATERPVWRVSMVPMEAYKLVASLRMGAAVDAFYDWQGGLVWLAHGRRSGSGGRARADPQIWWRPCDAGSRSSRACAPLCRCLNRSRRHLAALSKRLKQQFDPSGILNPGRMVAGV